MKERFTVIMSTHSHKIQSWTFGLSHDYIGVFFFWIMFHLPFKFQYVLPFTLSCLDFYATFICTICPKKNYNRTFRMDNFQSSE